MEPPLRPGSGPKKPYRLVNVTQAAKIMGMSRWTVRVWYKRGDLPYRRLPSRGGKRHMILFDVDDLIQFMERSKDRDDPPPPPDKKKKPPDKKKPDEPPPGKKR